MVLSLGDGTGGGEGAGVGRGDMKWSYGMDGSKGNEVISTAWYRLLLWQILI